MFLKLLERIESFCGRLNVYTEVPPSSAFTEELAETMADSTEVLPILGIATTESEW